MKKIFAVLLVVVGGNVFAQDDGKGTCPTIHGCPPAGVTKEEWSKDTSRGEIPQKTEWDKRREEEAARRTIEPAIGMKISADDFFEYSKWFCRRINRTITISGESDQVVCEQGYVYIDKGVITSIQKQ